MWICWSMSVEVPGAKATARLPKSMKLYSCFADRAGASRDARLLGAVATERTPPVLLDPDVADRSADIEAGPVIGDRQHARGRRLVDRLRNICRQRGAAERGRAYQSHKQTTQREL